MTIGFQEVQFPPAIAYGASGGPAYSTDIVATGSGYEQRNIRWAQARGSWNVGSGVRDRADMLVLLAFFRAMKGRAYGFRFKDWSDFSTADQPIGTGDGVTAAFQMVNLYVGGPVTEIRTITKPVAGTVAIQIAGVPEAAGRWTVDTTTGIVTFTANQPSQVAGISNANPCVITTTANHWLQTGDSVNLSVIEGTTRLNGNRYAITQTSAFSFSLNGVDATGFGVWTGGGAVNTFPQAGEAITASFEFDVPVRFDTDSFSASIETFEMQNWSQIPIVEIRV
ncbi:MAG: TIGR02217 family protein [Alphaproteobacteria bacterium]|nr:TIGR02217 family protein [Alphaproteobacteria bacterium]